MMEPLGGTSLFGAPSQQSLSQLTRHDSVLFEMLFGIRCDGHVSLDFNKSNFDPFFPDCIRYGDLWVVKKE